MSNIRIFLDMDGVVADFDKSYETITGVSVHKDSWEAIRYALDNSHHIFADAELMPNAMELYQGLLALDPDLVFLSSLPYKNYASAYQQKIKWLSEKMDVSANRLKPVFTGLSKHHVCTGKQDILIDDYDKHINDWEQLSWGSGILYKSQPVEEVLTEVKRIAHDARTRN